MSFSLYLYPSESSFHDVVLHLASWYERVFSNFVFRADISYTSHGSVVTFPARKAVTQQNILGILLFLYISLLLDNYISHSIVRFSESATV